MVNVLGFDRRTTKNCKEYKLFRVTEPDLKETVLIEQVQLPGECDEPEDEEFIKDDD